MEIKKLGYRVVGSIDQNNSVIQYFICPINYLSGISIKFGTYHRINYHHLNFRLSLIAESLIKSDLINLTEKLFFESTVWAAGIIDNSYFHIYFPTILNSKGNFIKIVISSPDAKPNEAVTIYICRTNDRIPGHIFFESQIHQNIESDYGIQAKLINSSPIVDTSYPEGILYSPLSSCNMNCIHCISKHSRQRVVSLSEDIKRSIKEKVAIGNLRWLFTDYSGDIFFADHKQPGELDFILGLGIAIHIDTNGAYLNDSNIEKIMMSKVDTLSFSIDAATNETYQKIRIGSPAIEKTFNTVKSLVSARTRYKRNDSFSIKIGLTMMLSNISELPLFIQKAAEIGVDAVGCRHLEIYKPEMENESLVYYKEYFNSIRNHCIRLANKLNIKLLIGDEILKHSSPSGNEPCLIPWNSAVVLANGDVMACCVPGSKMGNLNENSFEEIWQNENYQQLRSQVNSINPSPLCKSCQFRKVN